MKPMTKAIAIAVIHVCIIGSLGAKLLYDRHTRPRAWFKTQRYDPNLPIRGRYLSLQVEVNDPRSEQEITQKYKSELAPIESRPTGAVRAPSLFGRECGSIEAPAGTPAAVFDPSEQFYECSKLRFIRRKTATGTILVLDEPILFFISDTAKDPSRLATGEDLWVLATIPRKGLPRPIALGLKKAGETAIQTLDLN